MQHETHCSHIYIHICDCGTCRSKDVCLIPSACCYTGLVHIIITVDDIYSCIPGPIFSKDTFVTIKKLEGGSLPEYVIKIKWSLKLKC